jgi:hypothetical protein
MADETRPPDEPLLPKAAGPLPEGVEIALLLKTWPWEWQSYAAAEAPDVQGDVAEFVTLADGSLIVEVEDGDASLGPLADAIEAELERPYRARGIRRQEHLWFVAGKEVVLVELPGVDGDRLELSVYGGERTANVDGDLAPLDRLAADRGLADYAATATRLDGVLWEVELNAL